MKIDLKWLLKNSPLWALLLLFVTLIIGSFEGVINGIILGGFPDLVGASSSKLITFLFTSTISFMIVYTGVYLEQIMLIFLRKVLKVKLKETMLRSSFIKQDSPSVGLNRVSNDAAKIDTDYFQVIAGLLENGTAAIISTIYVLHANWLMGIIFIAFSSLSMLPMMFGKAKLGVLGKKWSLRNETMMRRSEDWLKGYRDIVQYHVQKPFFKKVTDAIKSSENMLQKQEDLQWMLLYINFLLTILAFVGPWAIGFYFIVHHQFGITISILLSLTLTANNVVQNIRGLMSYWAEVASTNDIRQLDVTTETDFPSVNTISAKNIDLTLENVKLAYGEKVILDRTDLKIPYGSKVMLQGPSGVGKSSLLNLLSGFKKPTNGRILVGEHDVEPTDVTYIAQDPWLFAGTVKENLNLGENIPEARLIQVLKDVGLWDELGEAPLDRTLIPEKDDLSGGQKQRLVIARALLRQRPILLLDEITASIDDHNADQIRNVLYRFPQTIVESAHHINQSLERAHHFKVITIKDRHIVTLN